MENKIHHLYEKALGLFQRSAEHCTDHICKISAAFDSHSGFTQSEKYYHGAKLAGMGCIVLASIFTLNVEGAIAGGFAVSDEVLKLEEAGDIVLKASPK